MLVVDKPSGMAVHSGSGLAWGLIDVVRRIRPDGAVELVHRLDRETSGCVVLARSGEALRHLSAEFREGRVSKHYLCLLDGVMQEQAVEVDVPLAKSRSGEQSKMRAGQDGKPARTRFQLLQAYPDCSYVEAELFTGRTHQIRVHAQHLGLPLAGDDRYGDRASVRQWRARGLKRTFLHAHRLGLVRPDGREAVFDAPLPQDLRRVLDQLDSQMEKAASGRIPTP
jgi:23S rRNA pseudouridine955/2504/2580 synthase